MRKCIRYLAVSCLFTLATIAAFAQTITLTGNVKNSTTKEAVPAVSVTIKGGTGGTFTNDRGQFSLQINQQLPVTLVISAIGFTEQEFTVNSATEPIAIELQTSYSMGEEIVVAASRTPERILESPVTIERMNSASIRNAPAASYYDAVANLKGVDLTTSSLTFKTPSTRGFNGSGNLRFNQLVDGMDNQAPGLNFAVGSIIGLTELDVESMELLSGASSALYGSGGMNGTLLINSKNPFRYQGLSYQVRVGVMHVDNEQRKASPYYDFSLRWGKKISEKFAFKISSQFVQAQDWQANDRTNLARNNVFSSIKPGDRNSDPNYDGVNVFGDEVSASMTSLSQALVSQASTTALPLVQQQVAAACGCVPTADMINAAMVQFLSTNPQTAPFYLGLQNNVFGNQSVSRTGYDERDLVDYNTYNFKLSGGLYYKITPGIEASLMGYWGTGTTVYTGADRYSLKDLKMGQYKLEVKGSNWFLRGYTTQENSGDSYASTIASILVNRAWKPDAQWLGEYTGNYSGAVLQGAPPATAHTLARQAADAGRYLPGTPEFKKAFTDAISKPIGQGGAKFADKTDLYHFEGQYKLPENKIAEVIVGGSFRNYVLNSQGTIFVDTAGTISISEYGAYLQAQRKFLGDVLKLTGSVRYDKNENFDGRFTPRVTAVVQVARDNNIRLSYQTAYRFPSAQDQYINLQTPGSRLIGGLPQFNTYFKFNTAPAFTAESVVAFRNAVGANPNAASIGAAAPLLQASPFITLKPESVASYELGYKGLIAKKLLIDVYGYYSRYQDFIARKAVARGINESTDPNVYLRELYSPFTTNNYSFVTNSPTPVKAIGWGASAQYQAGRGYSIMANIFSDKLRDIPAGLVTFFNTPELRFNLGLSNEDLYRGVGFNLLYRWQDKVQWEGTFGTGEIPSYGVLDAQVSYKLAAMKSMIKLGATNVTNKYYRSAFGNPQIGGLYYISFAYNVY